VASEEKHVEVKMELVEIGKRENTLIISAKGRMDVFCAPEFERTMERRIHEGKIDFVIDFSEISFISSSGLRSLLAIAKKLETKGGKLVLSGPKDAVKRVLEISGFYRLIPIYESVAAAVEKF